MCRWDRPPACKMCKSLLPQGLFLFPQQLSISFSSRFHSVYRLARLLISSQDQPADPSKPLHFPPLDSLAAGLFIFKRSLDVRFDIFALDRYP